MSQLRLYNDHADYLNGKTVRSMLTATLKRLLRAFRCPGAVSQLPRIVNSVTFPRQLSPRAWSMPSSHLRIITMGKSGHEHSQFTGVSRCKICRLTEARLIGRNPLSDSSSLSLRSCQLYTDTRLRQSNSSLRRVVEVSISGFHRRKCGRWTQVTRVRTSATESFSLNSIMSAERVTL